MPLRIIPAAEAAENARLPAARWPLSADAQAERLLPLAKPDFQPSFTISREDSIFTIGSCFARNIEKQLAIEGFDYASRDFDIPEPIRDFPGSLPEILNKFVVYSVLNELRWAFGVEPFPEDGYLQLRPGRYTDPHLHQMVTPSPLDHVQARRRIVGAYMQRAATANVFVMTLGLAEAWFDTKTGLYLNGMPHRSIREREPERFQFHVLEYNEILQCLEDIHALLTRFGRPDLRFLVTVSPVALGSTFSGRDALVANTYSKSVQRAAVEAFVLRHDNVDYFPSYESVVLSDRRRAWRDDQAHASDEIVRYNVLRMMSAYAGSGAGDEERAAAAAEASDLVRQAKAAAAAGDTAKAAELFQAANARAPNEAIVLLEHGQFLGRSGQRAEAIEVLRRSAENGGGRYGAYLQIAYFCWHLRQIDDAYAAILEARKFEPTRAGVLHLHGRIAAALGKDEEAMRAFEGFLRQHPDHEAALTEYRAVADRAGLGERAETFVGALQPASAH